MRLPTLKMATRCFARYLLATKQPLSLVFSHSYATATPNSSSFLFRLRPLVAALSASHFRRLVPVISTRAFSTRDTNSSLNDPNPNWSNRPPKETILLDGCDFEHWLVVMDPPEGDITRDEIIDSYIKTLAQVIGRFEVWFFFFSLSLLSLLCGICFLIIRLLYFELPRFYFWLFVSYHPLAAFGKDGIW